MIEAGRAEKKKAHAKMREEIRNAVKEAVLRDGINRSEFRELVREIALEEVKKVLAGQDSPMLTSLLTDLLKKELARVCGGTFLVDRAKEHVSAEVKRLAAKFVDDKVIIKSLEEKDTW